MGKALFLPTNMENQKTMEGQGMFLALKRNVVLVGINQANFILSYFSIVVLFANVSHTTIITIFLYTSDDDCYLQTYQGMEEAKDVVKKSSEA